MTKTQSKSFVESLLGLLSPALAIFIIFEACTVLTISKAVDSENKRMYNSATVVMVVELLKLCISVVGLWNEDPGFTSFRANISFWPFMKSCVPAALYALNNNIFLLVLTLINPSLFQLFLNMRVVWTGLMFRFILGRPITSKQWVALCVLLVGCSIAQYSTNSSHGGAVDTQSVHFMGIVLTLVYTFVSTTAGVVNEVLLKGGDSLHAANTKLYFFGFLFNVFALFYQGNGATSTEGYFRGWENPIVWAIVVLMALSGLLIAKIMQKYDNIVKIFCVAASNFVVYLFSVLHDSYPLTVGFIAAFVLVSGSAYYYQAEKNALDAAAAESSSSSSSIGASVNSAEYVQVNQSTLGDESEFDIEGEFSSPEHGNKLQTF